MTEYYLIWGSGDAGEDGVYRRSDEKQVASALYDFTPKGWLNLIGASDEFIDKVGREKDKRDK